MDYLDNGPISADKLKHGSLRSNLIYILANVLSDRYRDRESLSDLIYDSMCDRLEKETDVALLVILQDVLGSQVKSVAMETAFDYVP